MQRLSLCLSVHHCGTSELTDLTLAVLWLWLPRRWRQSSFLSHLLPSVHWAAADVWAVVVFSLLHSISKHADPPSALIGFVAVRFVSAGGPRRIKFPWRFIKEESLAECDCDPAGCSVRCRVQTRNQPDVSRDLGGGDRVNKSFCMWLLHIHSSGRAFRFICILPTGGSYYSEEIWQHFFMEQQQLISWSLKIDYFLTAACGPFWNKVELHAEWNSISVSGPS